jgi:hypothetical protein
MLLCGAAVAISCAAIHVFAEGELSAEKSIGK